VFSAFATESEVEHPRLPRNARRRDGLKRFRHLLFRHPLKGEKGVPLIDRPTPIADRRCHL
jgi:hypothetical protein